MSEIDKYGRAFNYNIPSYVLLDSTLTLVDLRTYALVRSFIDTTGKAYPSNKWFADKIGVDPRTIPNSCARLEQKGYLKRVFDENGKRYFTVGQPIPEEVVSQPKHDPKITPPMKHGSPPHDRTITQLDQKILDQNNNNICAASCATKSKDYKKQIFERLWDYYPLKKGKQKAYQTFLRLVEGKTTEEIEKLSKDIWGGIVGMTQEHRWMHEFRAAENPKLFVPDLPHGSTFFNQRRWLDVYETDAATFIANLRSKMTERRF